MNGFNVNQCKCMISKSRIKFIKSLHVKKFRERERLFIAEGKKIVNELIHSDYKIHAIYADGELDFLSDENVISISPDELQKISTLQSSQGVLAIVQIPDRNFENDFRQEGLTIMLDQISDPGNLGTMIRTADWFGVKHIICSDDSVDAFNPKVVQATMGSVFRVKIFYGDLPSMIRQLKERFYPEVYAATLEGKNISEFTFSENSVLILGNEARGINPELAQLCDEKVCIPKKNESAAESLNVSAAASIFCHKYFSENLKTR